jgi:hypothetical protein
VEELNGQGRVMVNERNSASPSDEAPERDLCEHRLRIRKDTKSKRRDQPLLQELIAWDHCHDQAARRIDD